MNNLIKNKKIIIAIAVVLFSVIGISVGAFLGKNSVKINPEKLNGLIDAEYTVFITNEKDDNLSLNFVGNLNEKAIEDLTTKLHKVGKNWKKENIQFNVFKTEAQNLDKFYDEDLLGKVTIDYEKDRAEIGLFSEVPQVDKAKKLMNYSKGDITTKEDKTVVVSMDMDLVDKSPTDVVSQAKAFIVLFKDSNNGKDINSVELHLNKNANSNIYNFNSDFENILETVKVLTF